MVLDTCRAIRVDDPVSGFFDDELPLPQTFTKPLVLQLVNKPTATAIRKNKN